MSFKTVSGLPPCPAAPTCPAPLCSESEAGSLSAAIASGPLLHPLWSGEGAAAAEAPGAALSPKAANGTAATAVPEAAALATADLVALVPPPQWTELEGASGGGSQGTGVEELRAPSQQDMPQRRPPSSTTSAGSDPGVASLSQVPSSSRHTGLQVNVATWTIKFDELEFERQIGEGSWGKASGRRCCSGRCASCACCGCCPGCWCCRRACSRRCACCGRCAHACMHT